MLSLHLHLIVRLLAYQVIRLQWAGTLYTLKKTPLIDPGFQKAGLGFRGLVHNVLMLWTIKRHAFVSVRTTFSRVVRVTESPERVVGIQGVR